jgi:hypothetical protein
LDLDSVLEQTIAESQKRIWFDHAPVAPEAVLSLAISQFDTSKRLTAIRVGSSHAKAQFSILGDHVKGVAIWADQSEHLLQGTPARHVNKTQVASNSQTTAPGAGNATGNLDPKISVDEAGQRQNFVIPPAEHKATSPKERLAALAKIRANGGLSTKVPGPLHDHHLRGCHLMPLPLLQTP